MRNREKKEDRYVTWMETLHPETAGIDAAAAAASTSESTSSTEDRWGVVWAEAHLMGDETNANANKSDEPSIAVEPFAPAMAVVADEETLSAVTFEAPPSSSSTTAAAHAAAPSTRPFWSCPRGHCFDRTLGFALLASAVATVVALELSAVVVYALSCAFYRLAHLLQTTGGPAWLLSYVFWPVVYVLQFTDSLLLSLSVLLTELLAGVAWLVCAPFGGCSAAHEWHQHVRKLCHLTRWAFRGIHRDWTPQRTFVLVPHSSLGIPPPAPPVDPLELEPSPPGVAGTGAGAVSSAAPAPDGKGLD